ncbi:MAG: hypothetical protein AAF108_02980 [Planctomycetota bacterium]
MSTHATLVALDDLVTRAGARRMRITPWQPVDQAVQRAQWWHGIDDYVVTHNGVREAYDPERIVRSGDTITVAPRPRDGGVILTSLAVAAVAGAIQYAFLRPKPRAFPSTARNDEESRFSFSAFSSNAFAGDTIPVIVGERKRYGGKVISKVPGEGENGDQLVRMLIDYGEGPIQQIGSLTSDVTRVLASDVEGLYINNQPIANFQGVRVSVRMGTQDQESIPGFEDTETVREVGAGGANLVNDTGFDVTDEQAGPAAVSYSTADPVDAVVLRVRFPQGLYQIGSTGQWSPRSVELRYRYRLTDDGSGPGEWSAWASWTVSRSIQSQFTASLRVDGLNSGGQPQSYDIQLERVSVDLADSTVLDSAIWDNVVEVRYSENTYAGQALLALELIAGEQLSGIPNVSADVRGQALLPVPDALSDADATGTTLGYSDNPAVFARAVIENTRWGAGAAFGDTTIDKTSWLEWAMYCGEAVPRAAGGQTRPRFAFNDVLDAAEDAYDLLVRVCEVGRCTPQRVGDLWKFIFDRPQLLPSETFTDATIAAESDSGVPRFTYTRRYTEKGLNAANRLICQFENNQQDGRTDVVSWPAQGELWLATETENPRTIQVRGVTDPEQLVSQLKYLLKGERFRTRGITFETTVEIPNCLPGELINVAMSVPGYGLASGHVREGSSRDRVLLDRTVTLEAGKEYTLRIVHLDATVEVAAISTPAGSVLIDAGMEVATSFAQRPREGAQYVVGETGIDVKPFLVQAVRPVGDDELRWEIDALEYAEDVYDDAADVVDLPNYSTLSDATTPPGPVINLRCFQRGTSDIEHFVVSFDQLPKDREITVMFRVYRRRVGDASWLLIPGAVISNHSAIIGEVDEPGGGFEFLVVAVSASGAFLSPNDEKHPTCTGVFGLGEAYPDPPAFASLDQLEGNTYRLSWNPVPGVDGYQVLAGGNPDSTLPNVGAEGCFVLQRTSDTQIDVELTPGQSEQFWVRSVVAGRLSVWQNGTPAGQTASVASAATAVGQSIRGTEVFDLSSEGTLENAEYTDGELQMINPGEAAVWTSPEVDLITEQVTQLTVKLETANDTDDPIISTDPFELPSVEADQWGVVSDSPIRVGMLTPPFPDNELVWTREVRTAGNRDNLGPWQTLNAMASLEASMRKYQIRITMTRQTTPYRPSLRGVTVVVTS